MSSFYVVKSVLFSVCLYDMSKMYPQCFSLEHLNHCKLYGGYTGMNLGRSKNLFAEDSVQTFAAACTVTPGKGIKRKCQHSYFYVF